MSGQINIDRFYGEVKEANIWRHCGYCGAPIRKGQRYSMHEGLIICGECEVRYAYSCFERNAVPQTAGSEDDDE